MKKNAMYSNLESVEQLFRQYYKVLRVYAFRFVNDWDVAEDIVQDVFVALWNKRADIEFDGVVKAYLLRPSIINLSTFSPVRNILKKSPWNVFQIRSMRCRFRKIIRRTHYS